MKDLDFKQIGMNIRKRRKELGLTQEYVAICLDVNPSHVSNIEGGRAHPSLTALVNIANIMTCSIDVFISHEYTFSPPEEEDRTEEQKATALLARFEPEKKEKALKILQLL